LSRVHGWIGRCAVAVAVRLKRPVSLGVRVLAFNDRGEVLLVRHSYRPGLSLPGGGVDAGETCREAAIRECREEAGVDLPQGLRLVHVYLNRVLANRDHVVLFAARGAVQPVPHGPGLEILTARFYPVDDLPADVTEATRIRIAEVLRDDPPPDHW